MTSFLKGTKGRIPLGPVNKDLRTTYFEEIETGANDTPGPIYPTIPVVS
jgi:hypothetical protein